MLGFHGSSFDLVRLRTIPNKSYKPHRPLLGTPTESTEPPSMGFLVVALRRELSPKPNTFHLGIL